MNDLAQKLDSVFSAKILALIVSLRHFLGWLVSSFSCRVDLVLENMPLRRQLLALHAQRLHVGHNELANYNPEVKERALVQLGVSHSL